MLKPYVQAGVNVLIKDNNFAEFQKCDDRCLFVASPSGEKTCRSEHRDIDALGQSQAVRCYVSSGQVTVLHRVHAQNAIVCIPDFGWRGPVEYLNCAPGFFEQGQRYDTAGCVIVLRDEFQEMMTRNKEDHSRYRKKKGQSGQILAEVARLYQDRVQKEYILVRSCLRRPSWVRLCGDPSGEQSHGNEGQLFILAGGAPTWDSPRLAMLQANATLGQRITCMKQTRGWLANDELSHVANCIHSRHSHYTILPIAYYNALQDEFCFEQEGTSVPNTGLTCLPILFGNHWIGVEFDRQHPTPEIMTLEAPPSMQTRLEFFICHLLQIPAHRLHIWHNADTTPPNMCGWGLLQRWIHILHAQEAFRDVHHHLHALADVNRRIIHRALQSSIEDWALTGASDTLQQVAYTLRLSFLVHLFQFDAGIHSRLDSLAISAAGQPPEVFEAPSNLLTDVTASVPSGSNPPQETQQSTDGAPESHEVHNRDAECQTEVGLHGIYAQDQMMQSDIPPHIWQRLQSMCLQPSWAGSDELECIARIYQPFLQHVVILPCLSWDAEQQILWSISGAHVRYDLATSIVLLVETRLHWFLIRIDRLHDHFQARFFGCPVMHVHELNAFLHQKFVTC